MAKPVFEFRIESNVGTRNPIIARLGPQSTDMLAWLDASKDDVEAITELYVMTLRRRLVACYDIREDLVAKVNEQAKTVAETMPDTNQPNVVGLTKMAESFLYEVKNYLRDLLTLLQVAYGCSLKDASDLVDLRGKGHSELVKWANGLLGPDNLLTKIVTTHESWMGEAIRQRNAVEHPGGYSGTMTYRNMRRHTDNPKHVAPPTWCRTRQPEADMVSDMDVLMHNMLVLAEELLWCAISHKPKFPHIRLVEVPTDKRDPICPVRLRITISADLQAKLAEA